MLTELVAEADGATLFASLTPKVTEVVEEAAVGVPLTSPVELFSVSPAGKVPELMK